MWLNDGSCVRLRPQYPNHVWAYDLVQIRLHYGRGVRPFTIMDEYTREYLAIRANRQKRSNNVIETLAELAVSRGCGHTFDPITVPSSSLKPSGIGS